MISLSVTHPDILAFIRMKRNSTSVTGANISVKVTDEFMEAVMLDSIYQLRFPVTTQVNKDFTELGVRKSIDGVVYENIDARTIWSELVLSNYNHAEPGILFWDRVIEESPADQYEGYKSVTTNPCVREDTMILTSEGYLTIKDVVGEEVEVWNGTEFSKVTPKVTGKTNKWLDITFSDGSNLVCTPYHNFYTKDFGKLKASDLQVGTKLSKFKFPVIDFDVTGKFINLYAQGFYCGDGSLKKGNPIIDLYGEKKLLLPLLNIIGCTGINHTTDKIRLSFSKDTFKEKSFVPKNLNIKSSLSYLAGVIDSDGSKNSADGALNITSIHKSFLQNIKNLLHTLGCTGTIALTHEECDKDMPNHINGNSTYHCQDCYRLCISSTNVKKLMDLGLTTYRVELTASPDRDASRFIQVTSITPIEVEDELTYCFTEPLKNKGVFNGILTGNCGEIPLSQYDSCRLLSINAVKHIVNPWDDGFIDRDKLMETSHLATHMMDNIIDLEIEKVKAIIHKIESDPERAEEKIYELSLWNKVLNNAKDGRRAGISLIGIGDALAMCNIKYGSYEAIWRVRGWYSIVANSCYTYSENLAVSRGAFTSFEPSLDINSKFIQRRLKVDFEYGVNMGKPYTAVAVPPRRNIALLTIPPSGTLSLIWNNQSNGIEPVFSLYYSRRRKVDKTHKNITFVDDIGDCWEDYYVLHPYFAEWIDWYRTKEGIDMSTPVEELSKDALDLYVMQSPYYKSTAMDIDPKSKIDMIAAAQLWVDHSISNTTNLPKDIDIKVVSELYMYAWKQGLKGFTIYRDGSRSGVLNTGSTSTKFDSVDAVKRPKSLKCDVSQCTINGEKCIILVGKFGNRPYEVFVFNKGHEAIPSDMTTGILKKQKSRVYNLLDASGQLIAEDIISKFDTPDWEFVTRLISTALRHGTDVKYILEQLSKSKGSVVHVSKAIARQLRKYADTEISYDVCPACGGKLKVDGGCMTCLDCGHSKCS